MDEWPPGARILIESARRDHGRGERSSDGAPRRGVAYHRDLGSPTAWLVLAAQLAGGAPAPPPVSYRLRWIRAPGAEACIDAAALADRVGARLGRPVFDGAGPAAVVIDAGVEPGATGWRATIIVRGPDGLARGARQLDQPGPDCHALDEPLTLVLALMIDLDATSTPLDGATPPPPPRPRTPWRGEVALAAAAGLGVVPALGGGGRVAVTIDAPWLWPVVVGGAWWADGRRVPAGASQGVRLRPRQVDAALCPPAWRRGRVRLAGCGGGALARVDAAGIGFDRNHAVTATVVSAAVAGRAALDLVGPVFVAAELTGEVRLNRPRFVVDDDGDGGGSVELYRVAPVAIRAGLGLGVRF